MGKRPHIVIFNPDQWRGDVMGHLGNPAAITPNLDQFVRTDAVSFRHAYCQNPVCTPSRCSFMSGWYPHVRGHRTMHHMLHSERGETNLLKVLKDSGYYVWWAGKNDLVPAQDGYDAHCDVKYEPSQEQIQRWGFEPRRGHHDDWGWRGEPDGDNFYSFHIGKLDKGRDDIYLDSDWKNVLGTAEFIRSCAAGTPDDKPLCLYIPLTYPHPPYGVEEPYYSAIDRGKIPDRVPAPDDGSKLPSIMKGLVEGQHLTGWTEERWRELRAAYYGMCMRVDHQFGLIVEAMKEAGLYDGSAVFFFSDHGDYTGDFGIVEKTQNTFQDCLTRVPFAVKPPKGTPVVPRVSEAMVELIDFTATAYQIAGVEPGYDHFGRSLLPVIAGQTDEHRDAVHCEGGRRIGETQASEMQSMSANTDTGLYSPRLRLQITDAHPYHSKAVMTRTRDFKYVLRLYETDELYDLRRDPDERINVVDDPAFACVLADMKDRTLRWLHETSDVVPRDTDRR